MKLEVKNFKPIKGHDGQGFTCTLYVDGVRTAEVFDDGWGGEHQYTTLDKASMDKFDAHVKSQPPITFENTQLPTTHDMVVSQLIDEYEFKSFLRKECKTKTLFQLPTDNKDEWRTVEHVDCDKVREFVKKKYGANVTFANDLIK